jgi:hypothetical protein
MPPDTTNIDPNVIVVCNYGDEIIQLRAELAQRLVARDALVAENAALKAERDEARRDWCYAVAIGHERAEERARLRGWDCFKEVKP